MTRDSGNTLPVARSLNLATGSKTRRETIGGKGDPRDFFKFNLTSRSSFDLSLKKLRSNVDVTLLDSTRKVIASSRRLGRKPESIKTTLEAGTFYVRLNKKGALTRYELNVSATPVPGGGDPGGGNPGGGDPGGGNPGGGNPGGGNPGGGNPGGGNPTLVNTAPTIATNTAVAVSRNETRTIGRNDLFSSDTQQTADQLIYRVTTLPAAGSLFLNGSPLAVGSAFSQTDIDNNRLTYRQNSTKPVSNTGEILGIPKISGSNIVWAARDSTGDSEIFLYRGSTEAVTQLTNNAVNDLNPEISGSNVVWQSSIGNSAELYLYNGTTEVTTQLTNNSVEDSNAKISDSHVVWERRSASGDRDIWYYGFNDILIRTVNSSSTLDDSSPVIFGSKIAFLRDDRAVGSITPDGVYFADLTDLLAGGSETQVSTGNALYLDRSPQIYASTVVWQRDYANGNRDIQYDTTPLVPGFQSVDISTNLIDTQPLISASNIVFRRTGTPGGTADGGYLFNISTGTSTRFIPASAGSYSIDSIDITLVGWTNTSNTTANLYNIFAPGTSLALDGGVPIQAFVSVSGGNAAWMGRSTTSPNNRLFFYDGSILADNFGFSVSDGSLTTNGTFNFTISPPLLPLG